MALCRLARVAASSVVVLFMILEREIGRASPPVEFEDARIVEARRRARWIRSKCVCGLKIPSGDLKS